MNIVVLVKQVPDTTEITVDKKTGTLIRAGVPTITNPDDLAGLEAVLALKDKDSNIKVSVVTMGPPQADSMLRELLAMGADEAYLITDRAFAGSDTWATSNIIAKALENIPYDLIVAGRQAIDGDTAQVGPQVAAKLDLPQVTYVEKINSLDADKIVVTKSLDDRYEEIEMQLPGVITTLSTIAKPRYMRAYGIFHAFEKEVKVITYNDLMMDKAEIGLAGSPTNVQNSFGNTRTSTVEVFRLSPEESAMKIITVLSEQNYI